MSALTQIVVPVASTVAAAGAIATAGYARSIVKTVAENEERSMDNEELLRGDPEVLSKNVVQRLKNLEEETNG